MKVLDSAETKIPPFQGVDFMKKFRTTIASPPDRDKLVAEIFFDDIQWAEINQEKDQLEVEFHHRPDSDPWRLEVSTAILALEEARKKLIG